MPIITVGKFHYNLPLRPLGTFLEDRSIVKGQQVFENNNFIQTSIEESIEKFSQLLRRESKEHLCLFKPDGNLQYKIDGSEYSVITPDEVDASMAGKISLHNHPMVQSFSPMDIKTHCYYNANKLYVVDRKYRYLLERSGGQNLDKSVWEKIDNVYARIHNETQDELIRTDELTHRELLHHTIWKKICSRGENDLLYTVEKLQPNGEYIKYYQTPEILATKIRKPNL